MSRNRVVMVVGGFPTVSETFIVSKFLGLLDHGFDMHVLCSGFDPTLVGRFPGLASRLEGRVHVVPRFTGKIRDYGSVAGFLASSAARQPHLTTRSVSGGFRRRGLRGAALTYLDAPLLELRPDVVHFEFGSSARGRMHLKDVLGCKVSVSFRGHDLNFVGLDDPHHYDEVFARADRIHFLGRDLWRRALRRGCPPDAPHTFIPPAIDAASLDPGALRRHGSAPGHLRLLSIARLAWAKGHEDLLQATRILLDRGVQVHLRIVGDGPHRDAVAFCRRELQLTEHVDLVGNLAPAEVVSECARADVFVHTSISEGFCNAVLEAQAMELPVVCTDADGLPENVEHGRTGFVVPRRDPKSVADRIALLAGDNDLRARMGSAGRARVLERFNLPDHIDAWARFYDELLYRSTGVPA